MAEEERCPTKLLTDRPAEVDEFGGHDRVAQAVVEVLQTETGGRSIGLEGGWGTGKSTIVNLITKRLRETKGCDYRAVEFDMWAHQGDPLRRTFLENLITDCIEEFEWVNQKKWERIRAELTRRRRVDTSRVVPKLTGAGMWFALTLLAIPLGSALISTGATMWVSENPSQKLATVLFILGLALVLAPAIYYGVIAAIRYFKGRSRTEASEQYDGLSELPALVTGQGTTESSTIVTQTPDPTSVEFETVFRDLLDDALEPKSRKLLLVIDNLDRVEPSDALSIWSTLQTFLGHSDYQQPVWIDRLWVLIPYDGDAILRLWDLSASVSGEGPDLGLAKSFLDKTFQLRFKAPPLLILNWRNFLTSALREALPNHDEADFRDVYRAYAVAGGFESSSPTPRGLKLFVNQIGVLHRERQDEFPLASLASYVLLRRDAEDIQGILLSKEGSELASRIIGEGWRGDVAALHFGVPTQEANQILLRGHIDTALTNGDAKAISDLASIHSDAFWTVLEDTVPGADTNWNDLSPDDIASPAIALAESGIFCHAEGRPEATAILSSVQSFALSMNAWNPLSSRNVQGMSDIARLVGDSEGVVPALLEGVSNAQVNIVNRNTPGEWMTSVLELVESLQQLGFGEQMGEGLKVSLNAQQWGEACQEITVRDKGGQLLRYFDLQSISEIDEIFAEQVNSGEMNETTFAAVETAIATRSGNSLNSVAGAVFRRLQSGSSHTGGQINFMLKTLRSSKLAKFIPDDQYESFATGGYYLHHLYYAHSERHPKAVGECLFGYLQAVPNASEPSHVGNSPNGYSYLNDLLQNPDSMSGVVEHFTVIAKETQQLPAVIEMANRMGPVPPFLVKVLQSLLLLEDVHKPVELVRENWRLIRDVLDRNEKVPQRFWTFLQGLPEFDNLVGDIIEGSFNVRDSGLYVALLQGGASADLAVWCANHVSSIGEDTWSDEIESQGDLVELAVHLKNGGTEIALGPAYSDALLNYVERVASGTEVAIPNERWHELTVMLNSAQHELLPRRVYAVLESVGGQASEEFFESFGEMLSDPGLLVDERRFIDRVCTPLLDANHERGIAWIANIAESAPALLSENSYLAAVDDFKDRIQQNLNVDHDDGPMFQNLTKIAEVLGIDPEHLEAESTD